jgi:hypothetical protein
MRHKLKEGKMTKIVSVLVIAVLFAAGIFFSGPGSLFAASEEETAEEFIHNEDTENAAEEEQEDAVSEEEHEDEDLHEDEDQGYPDEKYQDDRG